jgi:hypothetical protein
MKKTFRRGLFAVAALALVGCGGGNSTPVSPSPPPPAQIAGAWSGTFEALNYAAESIAVDLNQVTGSVTGTWVKTSPGDREAGNITGTVDRTAFTGTITFTIGNGPTCSASFSGPASSATLNWSSPGFTGNCGLAPPGNPVNVRFVLQRR